MGPLLLDGSAIMDDVWDISTTYSWINFHHSYSWSITSGMWYTTMTLCDPRRDVQCFCPAGGFPGRPEPWRGRRLGTAEAVPRERIEPRPGRRPLVSIGRAATNRWSCGDQPLVGRLGPACGHPREQGPAPFAVPCRLRSHADARSGAARWGRFLLPSCGILYTIMPLRRAMLSRHG